MNFKQHGQSDVRKGFLILSLKYLVFCSLHFLCSWLERSAEAALSSRAGSSSSERDSWQQRNRVSSRIDPRHVHCIAAILWFSNARSAGGLQSLVSLKLFRYNTATVHSFMS